MRALRSKRGFTLVEVSIVVVCVSVLAALAVLGFIRYRRTARMSEATSLIGSIKSEQEAHKGESGLYTTVSNSITSYYPASNPGKFVTAWGGACSNCVTPNAWTGLGVKPAAPVAYGYATIAGVGDEVHGSSSSSSGQIGNAVAPHPSDHGDDDSPGGGGGGGGLGGSNACSSIAPTDPYYLIQAQGDTDGDGVACTVLALSCSNSLVMTNVGE